jgi:DNA polymerase I-like protein with 3'-5' exonuclease and polymerase domains
MTETRYPDLSHAKLLAFDTETYEKDLEDLGPGVYRGDGSKLLGISLSDGCGFSEYYNLGHYDCDVSEREHNVRYLREVLGSSVPKLGQNIQYDVDWVENGEYKIKVNGDLHSIEIAEALIDETQGKYNLDFMSKKYLNAGKRKSGPDRFCEEHRLKGDFRAWLWKMPYDLVREYAIGDAEDPLKIYLEHQKSVLEEQEMFDLYRLECNLIRVLVMMRKTGVLIDQDKRDRNGLMVQNRIEDLQEKLFNKYGEFNSNSSAQVAPIYDREGIKYPFNVLYKDEEESVGGVYRSKGELDKDPRVVKYSPNIDANFYKRWEDKDGPGGYKEGTPEVLRQIRELGQCRSHLDKFIMGSHVRFVTPDGLIHALFHNMRNDSFGGLKGTRSGRFSSSLPNLQQQPAIGVDEYWGRICREDFVAFPDHWWLKIDYSQIEYRFLAHFAVGPGSEELRAAYNNNADQDYHQFIMDLTGLKRRYAKNLNFGVAFGMGAKHMAEMFGWEVEYAMSILEIYHSRAPYVKSTIDAVEAAAIRRGWIRTFLKRRSHLKDKRKAYIMFCRLLQGSAADLMKKAMHDAYYAGVFDVLKLHATVHDELDSSVPKTKEGVEAARELQHIMETCLKLRVPVKAEAGGGHNWADGETKIKFDDWEKEIA